MSTWLMQYKNATGCLHWHVNIFENWLLHLVRKIIATFSFTIAQFDYILTFSLCNIFF